MTDRGARSASLYQASAVPTFLCVDSTPGPGPETCRHEAPDSVGLDGADRAPPFGPGEKDPCRVVAFSRLATGWEGLAIKYFADSIIKPYIEQSGYRSLCEIGASLGENTDRLLELGIELTIVDPCLDADLVAKYSDRADVHFHQGASLDVLPELDGELDCILIDGDHNWYTVHSELCEIERRGLRRPGGTIFFHDVMPPSIGATCITARS